MHINRTVITTHKVFEPKSYTKFDPCDLYFRLIVFVLCFHFLVFYKTRKSTEYTVLHTDRERVTTKL